MTNPTAEAPTLSEVASAAQRIRENVARVIVGKDDVIDKVLVALLSEGHILLDDVPGLGKTMLAKTLSRSLGLDFRRIQFTPDLMPADISGINIYNQKSGEFEFRPGPLLAQLVLADEINRASPRTQSALLEAMEERQLTVEGTTIAMERPFLVIATQNPVELEGTFPLPEAQLDRFLLRLSLGYPTAEEEDAILLRFERAQPLEEIEPVVSGSELLAFVRAVEQVQVHERVRGYIIALVHATREEEAFELGASPRASLALMRTSRALAAIRGRDYVLPDDVQEMASAVMAHRLRLSSQNRLRSGTPDSVLQDLLQRVPVPIEA
ncbi:MAG: MoxR family ATPase [Chloroflexi bacterium]|nr:MoxR family ATPase [Chloroflexota bacterium]